MYMQQDDNGKYIFYFEDRLQDDKVYKKIVLDSEEYKQLLHYFGETE